MTKLTSMVVGAAGGVGFELVKQLSSAGHELVGTVLDDTEAARVHAEIPDIELLRIDLSAADHIAPRITALLEGRASGLNHVAVCAAISPYGPLETAPIATLRRAFEINTVASVAVYQACMPLIRQSQGRFVLVSSFAGKVALPFIGHYSASKFALEALADVMRREAAQWGVNVIVVEPGGINTPMVRNQIATIGRDRDMLTPAVRELYGAYYERFEDLLKRGLQTAVDPALVASAIAEALRVPSPSTRYQVGDDSNYLCNVAARLSDAELDAVTKEMFVGDSHGSVG